MPLCTHVAGVLARLGLERTVGVAAVSGGPDSVALFHILTELLQAEKIERLILAHVNHQLRGAASDTDEDFVAELADPSVEVRTTRIDVGAIAHAEQENLESIARRERYRFFEQVASSAGAAWVATAHTADDQAETVLFRLLRGSGVLGLSGMAECRPLGQGVQLVRPLLKVRRQALLDFLKARQLPYCVDASNQDLRFSRNRIRHELLPMLRMNYNPGIDDVLCRLAEQAQDLHADLRAQAEALLQKAERPRAGPILVFAVEPLRSVNSNLVREMFRLVWQREAWPMGAMDHTRWQRLVEIALGNCDGCDFPGRIHGRRVGGVLQLRGPMETKFLGDIV
jgi:tRNA(Ile)-lysidine synthase